MASRASCVAVALGLALIPAAWDQVQPRPGHAENAAMNGPAADSLDRDLASVRGIGAWVRILALSDADDPARRAATLFVPSDSAMRALPAGMMDELVHPGGRALRRAFLARSATDARIAPKEIAGKRLQISTLDGRPLVIDATGGEIHVGDAEAIEIRELPDGRSLFILDDRISTGSADPD